VASIQGLDNLSQAFPLIRRSPTDRSVAPNPDLGADLSLNPSSLLGDFPIYTTSASGLGFGRADFYSFMTRVLRLAQVAKGVTA
jgi:hypothetical protein